MRNARFIRHFPIHTPTHNVYPLDPTDSLSYEIHIILLSEVHHMDHIIIGYMRICVALIFGLFYFIIILQTYDDDDVL